LKKKSVTCLGADNGLFVLNLLGKVRPLSTLFLAAGKNYSADEYENKANKVANGDDFVHGACTRFKVYYRVAG
jgi:hypothetical protein